MLLQTFFKHELTKQKMLSPFPKVISPNAKICTMYFPNVLAAAKAPEICSHNTKSNKL